LLTYALSTVFHFCTIQNQEFLCFYDHRRNPSLVKAICKERTHCTPPGNYWAAVLHFIFRYLMGGENQDSKVNTFVSKLPLLEHVTHIVKGLLDKFNKEGGWNIAN
jgi:hypothetical protein